MATFHISANDTDMGEYTAGSAASALDAYARDAGYKCYADVAAQFGDDAIAAVEIDTGAPVSAAEKASGRNCWEVKA